MHCVYIHPLKLTCSLENRLGPKRKLVFQASVFSCYVSFSHGNEYIYIYKYICTCVWLRVCVCVSHANGNSTCKLIQAIQSENPNEYDVICHISYMNIHSFSVEFMEDFIHKLHYKRPQVVQVQVTSVKLSLKILYHTVNGRNPANHWIGIVYNIICRVFVPSRQDLLPFNSIHKRIYDIFRIQEGRLHRTSFRTEVLPIHVVPKWLGPGELRWARITLGIGSSQLKVHRKLQAAEIWQLEMLVNFDT